jgi:hypothetical protein
MVRLHLFLKINDESFQCFCNQIIHFITQVYLILGFHCVPAWLNTEITKNILIYKHKYRSMLWLNILTLYFTNNVWTQYTIVKVAVRWSDVRGRKFLSFFFLFRWQRGLSRLLRTELCSDFVDDSEDPTRFKYIAHIEQDRVANHHGELLDQVNTMLNLYTAYAVIWCR